MNPGSYEVWQQCSVGSWTTSLHRKITCWYVFKLIRYLMLLRRVRAGVKVLLERVCWREVGQESGKV